MTHSRITNLVSALRHRSAALFAILTLHCAAFAQQGEEGSRGGHYPRGHAPHDSDINGRGALGAPEIDFGYAAGALILLIGGVLILTSWQRRRVAAGS